MERLRHTKIARLFQHLIPHTWLTFSGILKQIVSGREALIAAVWPVFNIVISAEGCFAVEHGITEPTFADQDILLYTVKDQGIKTANLRK